MRAVYFFLLVVLSLPVSSQKEEFKLSANIGVSIPFLDGGTGIHFGVNPSYLIGRYFAFEGQLSYNWTKITHTFISGNTGSTSDLNALVGGRIYVLPETRRMRMYLNLLAGYGYFVEDRGDPIADSGLGMSSGIYLGGSNIFGGVALERLQSLVFKVGWSF